MLTADKPIEVKRFAQELHSRKSDWVTFYREVLGPHGIIRRIFPTQEALAEFKRSETYDEIQEMLAELREQSPTLADPGEPTKVITVRLPKSMHDALRVEAFEHRTSMNKLCISKLLQFIESQRVPTEVP